MRKLKQPEKKQKTLLLNEFLDTYSAESLRGALLTFEASTGWQLLQAYIDTVQRRYEVDSLDLIGKGDTAPAAYASGYAKALDELKTSFVAGLHQTILGKSQVIENDRPEE